MTSPLPDARTDPAEITAGDQIEVRDAHGQWHRRTARSGVRVDAARQLGRRGFPSVAVGWSGDDDPHAVNWPAEDVRAAAQAYLTGAGQ